MRALCFVISAAAAAATAGACAPLDPQDLEDLEDLEDPVAPAPAGEFFIEPGGGDSCPPNSCGDPNSPVIDGVYFWRLNLPSVLGGQGLANPEKVRITNIFRPGPGNVPMQLELVGGDRLRGFDGANFFNHTQLEGTRIVVSKKDAQGVVKQYVIWIEHVSPGGTGGGPAAEHFWVGNQHSIEAYDFFFRPIAEPDTRIPLCEQGADPTRLRALVFGGDIYNPRTKTIQIGPETDGWINVACVDSAIYKMHKIGYTSAAPAKAGTPVASVERRRAMLNAWSSNVCTTDEVFTEQGTLIRLRESLGIVPFASGYYYPHIAITPHTVEAIWNEEGAVCLNTHRREAVDPGIRGRIEAACGELPTCDSWLGSWGSQGQVITGLP